MMTEEEQKKYLGTEVAPQLNHDIAEALDNVQKKRLQTKHKDLVSTNPEIINSYQNIGNKISNNVYDKVDNNYENKQKEIRNKRAINNSIYVALTSVVEIAFIVLGDKIKISRMTKSIIRFILLMAIDSTYCIDFKKLRDMDSREIIKIAKLIGANLGGEFVEYFFSNAQIIFQIIKMTYALSNRYTK